MAFKAKLSDLIEKADVAECYFTPILSHKRKGELLHLQFGEDLDYPDEVEVLDVEVEVPDNGLVTIKGAFRLYGERWERNTNVQLTFMMTRPINQGDMR